MCLSVGIMQGCSNDDNKETSTLAATPTQQTQAAPEAQPEPARRIDIATADLRKMIANEKDMFILDVRNPEELVSGPAPLKNTVNIPLPEIPNRFNELPRDKDIVIVCRTGRRSAIAADSLIQQGFTRIYNLQGGMTAYRAEER